jgi:hypothetical protein
MFSMFLAGELAGAPTQAAQPVLAPILAGGAREVIPGQYIVVFKQEGRRDFRHADLNSAAAVQSRSAQALVERLGGKVLFVYNYALVGFSATLPPRALKALRASPGVAWIEPDQRTHADTVQINPPTGLDRTSERLLPLDHRYTFHQTGAGVNVYIFDTGIRVTHGEFVGRASGDFTSIDDGNGASDCNGHGTHVAGIVGGATFGIAKGVRLHPVRVLPCSGRDGPISAAIAGVEFVTSNARHPAVANMSLGSGPSISLDTAVTNSIASGVTYVVSAGNDSANACGVSPARVPTAITVGAIDPLHDTIASFSNWGTCIDLFAPGVNILSSWNTDNSATQTVSGTSQAAPHVTGVVAEILESNPTFTPGQVWSEIHSMDDVTGTAGWAGLWFRGIIFPSPNELLHWEGAQSRLELFYTGPIDQLYHNWQTAAGGPWSGQGDLGGLAKQIAVGKNQDGRLELFYIGTDDRLYHNWQTTIGGTWSGQADLGGLAKQIAVGKNQDGRLELFYVGTDDHLYHNWQVNPNGSWSGQVDFGGLAKQIAVGKNQDGRLELFCVGTDDHLYHNWQLRPNGTWSDQADFGGLAKQIAVGTNDDGRLELLYTGTSDQLYRNFQTTAGGSWYGEDALGGLAKQIAVGKNDDGRLELLYVGTNDQLYHNGQTRAGGGWGGESTLGGLAKQIAIGANQDGRLELFYVGTDNALYHNWQVTPNGAWGGQFTLGGAATRIAMGENGR